MWAPTGAVPLEPFLLLDGVRAVSRVIAAAAKSGAERVRRRLERGGPAAGRRRPTTESTVRPLPPYMARTVKKGSFYSCGVASRGRPGKETAAERVEPGIKVTMAVNAEVAPRQPGEVFRDEPGQPVAGWE